jgi:hypothetical protein
MSNPTNNEASNLHHTLFAVGRPKHMVDFLDATPLTIYNPTSLRIKNYSGKEDFKIF